MSRTTNVSESGSIHLIILVGIAVFVVVGFAGMRIFNKNNDKQPSRASSSIEAPKTDSPPQPVQEPAREEKTQATTTLKIPHTKHSVSYPSGWSVQELDGIDRDPDGFIDDSGILLKGPGEWMVYLVGSAGGLGGGSGGCKDENNPNLPPCPTYQIRKVTQTEDSDLVVIHSSTNSSPPSPLETFEVTIGGNRVGTPPAIGVQNANQCVQVVSKSEMARVQATYAEGSTNTGSWYYSCLANVRGPDLNNKDYAHNLSYWIRFPSTLHNATDFSFEDQQGFQEAVAILASLKKE